MPRTTIAIKAARTFRWTLVCAATVAAVPTHAADASPFALACIGAGGTAGTAEVRSGGSRVPLYAGGGVARLSLSLAPSGDVHFIELTTAGQPSSEPATVTIRPGEGRILSASRLEISSMGGTVGKGVEYCIRPT